MGAMQTVQDGWKTLNRASVTVANGDKAATTTALIVSTAASVIDFQSKPASTFDIEKLCGFAANRARVRFLLSHASDSEGCTATARLWGWDANGGALALIDLTLTAGNAPILFHPVDNTASSASLVGYVDTIATSNDNCFVETVGTSANDGILEIRFDLVGMTHLFCDFDCDAGAGTTSTDAEAIIKFY